jgi:hypothetical protein
MSRRRRPPEVERCELCGCTEEEACEGGCGWSDPSRTLCTACEDLALEIGLQVLELFREMPAADPSGDQLRKVLAHAREEQG